MLLTYFISLKNVMFESTCCFRAAVAAVQRYSAGTCSLKKGTVLISAVDNVFDTAGHLILTAQLLIWRKILSVYILKM